MTLKKFTPFFFSIPILVLAMMAMYAQFKEGAYIACGLATVFALTWPVGVHVFVNAFVNRTGISWSSVDDSVFAKDDHFTSNGALLCNTNGIPMLDGGGIDIAGNPMGTSSSD